MTLYVHCHFFLIKDKVNKQIALVLNSLQNSRTRKTLTFNRSGSVLIKDGRDKLINQSEMKKKNHISVHLPDRIFFAAAMKTHQFNRLGGRQAV